MASVESELVEVDEPAIPRPLPMTEEEFDNWHEELLRGEWVDGKLEFMALANTEHCELQNLILCNLYTFVSHRNLGKAWGPQMAVKLPGLRRRRVPDIVFLGRERLSLVQKTHIDGAPDLIMEIVSPDSVRRDWRTKYLEYEQAGVKEYWIVDPAQRVVEAYHLSAGGAYEQFTEQDGRIASQAVMGFFLKPSWLWQLPAPELLDLLRELRILT